LEPVASAPDVRAGQTICAQYSILFGNARGYWSPAVTQSTSSPLLKLLLFSIANDNPGGRAKGFTPPLLLLGFAYLPHFFCMTYHKWSQWNLSLPPLFPYPLLHVTPALGSASGHPIGTDCTRATLFIGGLVLPPHALGRLRVSLLRCLPPETHHIQRPSGFSTCLFMPPSLNASCPSPSPPLRSNIEEKPQASTQIVSKTTRARHKFELSYRSTPLSPLPRPLKRHSTKTKSQNAPRKVLRELKTS